MTFLKRQSIPAIVMLSAILLISATVFAKNSAINNEAISVQRPVPVKMQTDLVVESIYARDCLCSEPLDQVDAMLYNELWITIGNWPCSGMNVAVTGHLQVSFFNESTNTMFNRTIPFSINQNSRKAIKVLSGPILMKASGGITARIARINGNVIDCNPANNTKTVKDCMLPPIY